MPAYLNPAKHWRTGLFLVGLLLISGCDQEVRPQRFEIQNVDLKWTNGRLLAGINQKLELSSEAREALQHGVPLTFKIELILRNTANQTRIRENAETYEIRYLPLSRHYQLTLPGGEDFKTFPRLRHLLAELADQRFTLRVGVLPSGDYELMTRSSIDRRKIPVSMRLPTLFRTEWVHDSHWSSWPLEISSPA